MFAAFLLPVAQLVYWLSLSWARTLTTDWLGTLGQSLGLALATAALTTLLAYSLVYASRWNPLQRLRWLARFSTIGYVVPGAVIGMGVLVLAQGGMHWAAKNLDLNLSFLLYSTAGALVYAY
ncbi:hypothetical protein RZS08_18240, partial [Arthrospira platensis SPKY1]|nr:hypothetical protein [Arthrospira platensis SPKY1]